MMLEFQKKTYGRIWVKTKDEVDKVREIIKDQDEFEFSYLPEDFVAVYAGKLGDLSYGHKFELDYYELTKRCLAVGIWIIPITDGRDVIPT